MEILQGVTVRVDGRKVFAKGKQGEVQKTMAKTISVKVNGNAVEVECTDPAIKGTTEAIIKGMMNGAANGYSKSMKLLHAHFPISMEVKGNDITIKNFLGEKQPRKTVLVGSTKIQVKGPSVIITGPDKESVGQTLANIRQALRIKDKDGRVFQDGIYDAE